MTTTLAKITASDIRAAMRTAYAQPEWAIMFEVRNAAGFDATRSADAVAMSLWPSRGLELHGFEIKVSRSDWKREAADPSKAEAVGMFCDRWWIAAPPGIVPLAELPPAWGLREWDGKRWSVRKDAEKTEAKPVTRSFLAMLLRNTHKTEQADIDALVEAKDTLRREQYDKRVADEVARRSRDYEELKQSIEKFETAAGVKLESWTAGDIGAAYAVWKALGAGLYGGAFSLADQHEAAAKRIRDELGALGIEPPEQRALPFKRKAAS